MNILDLIRKFERSYMAAGLVEEANDMATIFNEVEELIAKAKAVYPYIASQAIGCHGDKCREPWCSSCCGEEEAEEAAQMACHVGNELWVIVNRLTS